MVYDVLCQECDFRKVKHEISGAEEAQEEHESESSHSVGIEEYRMNA